MEGERCHADQVPVRTLKTYRGSIIRGTGSRLMDRFARLGAEAGELMVT